MNNSLSVIYRLADTGDALNLAALLWEQINEFDQQDIDLKDTYINDCHSHIINRLGKDLRTIPEYRNKGIGVTLMSHVIALCKEKNAEEIIVWPSEDSIGYYSRYPTFCQQYLPNALLAEQRTSRHPNTHTPANCLIQILGTCVK